MDTSNLLEFFDASKLKGRIHIIGCGAIGSTLAELLVHVGCTNITLYDFDTVEPKNVANQMFTALDIGMEKVDAVYRHLTDINPECAETVLIERKGLTAPFLCDGFMFMCVDSISLRAQIAKANMYNPRCLAMFDFRMRLTDAQHYAVSNSDATGIKNFLASMDFTSEEAKSATPVSACGVTLSVAFTVRAIVAFGVANFVKYIQTGKLEKLILVDMDELGVACI